MKFIVDAQLPVSLANLLRKHGLDVIHTKELPKANETSDAEINRISMAEERIVISKDGDFYDRYAATKEPFKLLHTKTGNITNAKLLDLFEKNLRTIISELEENDVVTVDQRYIIALH